MTDRDFKLMNSITDQIEYYSYLKYEGHVLSTDQKKHLRELRTMLVQHGFSGSGKWLREINNLLK